MECRCSQLLLDEGSVGLLSQSRWCLADGTYVFLLCLFVVLVCTKKSMNGVLGPGNIIASLLPILSTATAMATLGLPTVIQWCYVSAVHLICPWYTCIALQILHQSRYTPLLPGSAEQAFT